MYLHCYMCLCVCIYIWCGRYTCHSMSEVRGQLCGVSSLLPPFRGFRRSNCLPGLCDKFLTHWAVLASLRVLFLNTCDETTFSALPKILQTLSSLSCSTLCVNTLQLILFTAPEPGTSARWTLRMLSTTCNYVCYGLVYFCLGYCCVSSTLDRARYAKRRLINICQTNKEFSTFNHEGNSFVNWSQR